MLSSRLLDSSALCLDSACRMDTISLFIKMMSVSSRWIKSRQWQSAGQWITLGWSDSSSDCSKSRLSFFKVSSSYLFTLRVRPSANAKKSVPLWWGPEIMMFLNFFNPDNQASLSFVPGELTLLFSVCDARELTGPDKFGRQTGTIARDAESRDCPRVSASLYRLYCCPVE